MFLFKKVPFFCAVLTIVFGLFILNSWSGFYFSLKNISVENNALLAHEKDDHGYLTTQILREMESDIDSRRVYSIGGSTLREGLLTDRILNTEYGASKENHEAVRFVTLYSFDQTMAETARIALNAPIKPNDIVIIDLNPRRLSFDVESFNTEWQRSRLSILDPEKLDPISEELSKKWSDLKLRNQLTPNLLERRLFLRQWVSGRLRGQTKTAWSDLLEGKLSKDLLDLKPRRVRSYFRYAYGSEPMTSQQKQQIFITVKEERVAEYFRNREFGFELLDLLVKALRDKGAVVVFLEMPRSPQSFLAYEEVWEDFHMQVDVIADRNLVKRIDLSKLEFENDDFFDLEHILKPHRETVSQAFVGQLRAEILQSSP